MKVTVLVRPKPGMLDPQGEAIARSLAGIGFAVESVRAGRLFDLEVEAASVAEAQELADRAARQVLANELIERYEVEVQE